MDGPVSDVPHRSESPLFRPMTTPSLPEGIRTSPHDRIYFAFNDRGIFQFADDGSSTQLAEPPNPPHFEPSNPLAWDVALKLSEATGVYLYAIRAVQCRENALDINRYASHCVLEGDWGVGGGVGDQVITLKGGSHDIQIAGVLWSRGTDCDCEVGAWADHGFEPSYNLDFRGLRHADGKPIRFVFARVKHPFLAALGRAPDIKLPPGAKVLFWHSLAEQAYCWAKLAAVKLGLIGKKPKVTSLTPSP